jgi:hypothetical protein
MRFTVILRVECPDQLQVRITNMTMFEEAMKAGQEKIRVICKMGRYKFARRERVTARHMSFIAASPVKSE